MKKRKYLQQIINRLLEAGAEKAICTMVESQKKELNVESDKLTLFRTTFNTAISLTAYIDNKKGSISINKSDDESIENAVAQAIEFANSSESDEANEISEAQPAGEFKTGLDKPDLDLMYNRIDEFVKNVKTSYPKIILNSAAMDFTGSSQYFINSNGVDYKTDSGCYGFGAVFAAKEGKKSSSFNYSGFSTLDLNKPMLEYGSLKTLIMQSAEQLEPNHLPEKFNGEIIVTPDCLFNFLHFIISNISNYSMISGTSIYKDKLNKKIASDKLTLSSRPHSKELVENYFVTSDGYLAEDCFILEKGILKTFLLSLYGSRKTRKERSVNNGECYIVEPGNKSFDNMVKSVKKGLLVCRFSGGMPANNGDFSGVAKNSYYIENGQIQYPVTETMISGNISDMLHNIADISKERINYGSAISPWIQFSDISISGK